MKKSIVDSLSQAEKEKYITIASLHNWFDPDPKNHWNPHEGQEGVLKALFVRGAKLLFCQCGRKFGKTELVIYSLWRWCLLNPNSVCYYICPTQTQAKKIVWTARDKRGRLRLQEFGPESFIKSINNDELIINFKNGSMIQVDGADNPQAAAGLSPSLIILDEFEYFKPRFWEVMGPNRATFNCPVFIIGSPPEQIYVDRDTPHQYVELAQEARIDMIETGNSYWIKRPSWDNPDPSVQAFLASEKIKLFRRGKQAYWWREYGAELVNDNESKIFPEFISQPDIAGSQVIEESTLMQRMFYEAQ